jgi:hypothetical protein
MKKNFLGDIRPMTHLGSGPRKASLPVEPDMDPVFDDEPEPPRKKSEFVPPPPRSSRHWSFGKIGGVLLIALIAIGGALYGLSFIFRGATITITPKAVSGTVNLTLTTSQAAEAKLPFEVMTLPESVTKEIVATRTESGNQKASGTVVLYNFQTTSQQLVATTRFSDPSGKIFRLPSAVTIPKKTVSGGKDVPGQVTVTLVADVGGPEGNIGLSDFTVVAFKGTSKEKLVYGRGKTEFTGGSTGTVYRLSDEEHKVAIDELKGQIDTKLADEVKKQIPEGYILLPDSLMFIPDTELNNKNNSSSSATVVVTYSGKERGVLIKKDVLESFFLENISVDPSVTPDKVTILGEDKLAFSTSTDLSKSEIPTLVTFTVTGDITAVWKIDQDAVKKLLGGSKRSVFSSRMQTLESVASADLVLRPFWMNKIPTQPEKIKIIVTETKSLQ